MSIAKEIFRAYDIRGLYPSQINEEVFSLIGKAIGTKILETSKINRVCLCMDGRLSGPSLKVKLIEGLISTGINIVDIGILPTPLLNFSLLHLNIENGLMITGSHNPKDYNGIKIIINGKTLFDHHIKDLYEIIQSNNFTLSRKKGIIETNNSILDEYIKKVSKNVKINFEDNIAIDCGNGVTGKVINKIINSLNIKADIINEKVDGNFPNHPPDPSDIKNLSELRDKVISSNAKLGFAYDGDGDRVAAIRSDGSIIWPDQLLIIYLRDILKNNIDGKIIFDIKCTKHVEEEIKKNKGIPVLSRTGHSFIKKSMLENNALLGGELSGHIFFADKWYGFDDGIYASLRLLEILSKTEDYIKILYDLPDSITTPEINIPFEGNKHFTFMNLFVKLAKFDNASIIDIDGLKILYDDGWALIRCSNTTSNLVLRFEADNELALQDIQKIIKDKLLEIDDNLKLPF